MSTDIYHPKPNPGIECEPATHERQKIGATAAATLAFLIPCFFAYSFILNYFFFYGATFLDAGWFADLMWHKRLTLPNPSAVLFAGGFPPWSFYGIHITPIFSIISATSLLLPLDRVQIFALYVGISHGLLGFLCAES